MLHSLTRTNLPAPVAPELVTPNMASTGHITAGHTAGPPRGPWLASRPTNAQPIYPSLDSAGASRPEATVASSLNPSGPATHIGTNNAPPYQPTLSAIHSLSATPTTNFSLQLPPLVPRTPSSPITIPQPHQPPHPSPPNSDFPASTSWSTPGTSVSSQISAPISSYPNPISAPLPPWIGQTREHAGHPVLRGPAKEKRIKRPAVHAVLPSSSSSIQRSGQRKNQRTFFSSSPKWNKVPFDLTDVLGAVGTDGDRELMIPVPVGNDKDVLFPPMDVPVVAGSG